MIVMDTLMTPMNQLQYAGSLNRSEGAITPTTLFFGIQHLVLFQMKAVLIQLYSMIF